MRWKAKLRGPWRPWFAFLPLRGPDDTMIWLEPIWVRWAGDYSTWCPWEDNPNALLPATQAENPQEQDDE